MKGFQFAKPPSEWLAKEKCMKKIFAFIVIALALCGSAWGQIPGDNKLYKDFYEIYSNLYYSIFDLTDLYSAVPTTSTESRFSASRFDSSVGSFIDPKSYNPAVGTFFFLGGFPAGSNLVDTNYLTPGSPMTNPVGPDQFYPGGSYAVSLGFGKTITDDIYLAAYYGGSLANAFGQRTIGKSNPDTYDTYAFYTWRNKLALLLGIHGMGFRLDVTMNNPQSQKETTEDGKHAITKMDYGTGIALTWGTNIGKFSPYAKFGYKFSDSGVITQDGDKKMTTLSGGKWGFSTGSGYNLPNHSSLWADFLLGGQFKQSLSGDSKALIGVAPYRDGGSFGIGLKAGYSKTIEGDKASFGIGPNMRIGSTYVSKYSWTDDESKKYPSDNFFNFSMGSDLGLRFKPSDQFAFYTGAGFQILELNAHNLSGGKGNYKTKESEWELYGIDWRSSKLLAGGELGFGMTFSPSNYLSLGFGLNTLLDNIVKINIKKMTIESGDFWGADYDNFFSWATSMFNGVKFDMTVSFKIPSGGIPPEHRKSFKDYSNDLENSKAGVFIRDFKDFRAQRAAESEAYTSETDEASE